MKVLVCGSRHFNNYEQLSTILDGFKITGIISGKARGADTLALVYGKTLGIPCFEFPADWSLYGRRAGPIRNHQMLKEGKPDLVVAFLAPNSRGTKHMIEISQKAGIPVEIINV